MRIYIGFDDTDVAGADRETGKLARWFENKLPKKCRLWGVIRHQLPQIEGILFTSNNSSACVVVDTDAPEMEDHLIEAATDHIHKLYVDGSNPGLCVVSQNSMAIEDLKDFGRLCCARIVTQKEAMEAARMVHLSGHGGTNAGIIGAAAGVGLTLSGWSGRFVEFGRLRAYGAEVLVSEFEKNGIRVLSTDQNALVPWQDHIVETGGWVRPRLWSFGPVLPVRHVGNTRWRVVGAKNTHANA